MVDTLLLVDRMLLKEFGDPCFMGRQLINITTV